MTYQGYACEKGAFGPNYEYINTGVAPLVKRGRVRLDTENG